jgi:hypothetical protein
VLRFENHEFRASWLIRAAVLVALVIWLAVACAAAFVGNVPSHAVASIMFFIAFFVVFVSYYFSMAFVVHEYGVTYRGATEFEHFDWDEIVQVDSMQVPLGGYYVTTKRGGFVLSGFIAGHEALAQLIAARAGLLPRRS